MPKGKTAKRRAQSKAKKSGKDKDEDDGKKKKKDKGDREDRLTESVTSSATMEEALLKCCSHYDMEGSGVSAEAACEGVVAKRKKQLELCKAEFEEMVAYANAMFIEICAKDSSYKVFHS